MKEFNENENETVFMMRKDEEQNERMKEVWRGLIRLCWLCARANAKKQAE